MILRTVKKIIEYISGKSLVGESIRYVVVGALTTFVNLGLFELMWGRIGIDVTVSNVTSISVAIIFAYVTNKLVVFKWTSESLAALVLEFLKFVGSRLFTMAIEVGGLYLFFNILGYNARLIKLSIQAVVIIINYIISKLIVFRTRRQT